MLCSPLLLLPTRLSGFDLGLVAAYLVAITIFGLRFSKRAGKQDRSLKNYFLADNTIPWWAIALSIVSAETSTLTIVSIPGVAFAGNFGFLQVVLGYMVGRAVVALLFLPRYFRGEMLTAYQLIDRRFGNTLHKVTAGLFLLTRAAAEGVRVFAISIVVGVAIGTGDTLSIAIICALTLLYTFEGGLAAVIWTDVVQMALYVAGTVVALFTLSAHVPGGWSHIHEVAAPLGKFHMLNFTLDLTTTYTFWAGVLGGGFLTMASHGTDQLMVQRMLAARNLRESRIAILASGAVIFLQFTLFLLIGVGLFVFYGAHPPVFRSNDYIFPTFIVREMPHGIAGLLIAAILAAAMSNLSAALNSLASTSVVDFYMHLRPRAEAKERTFVSRAATVFWALVLFAMAVYSIQVGGKGHVVETGLSIASVAYGCLLGVFLLGTLTRYATQTGAIVGMICGFAINLILWLPTITTLRQIAGVPIPKVAFTWYVLIGSAVTFTVGTLASLVFRKQSATRAGALVLLLAATISMHAATPDAPYLASEMRSSPEGRPPSSVAAGTYDFTAISALVDKAIAEKKLPGAVVVVGHGGKVVFEKAYGNRALEPAVEPMTEDTIFDMASLTKVLVTSTAVLQLYEQGKVALDAPVAQYLPEFAVHGKQNVTIRELLTHTSGLPPDVDLKDSWGLAAPDKAEGIHRALNSGLVTAPGTHFEYSDINFITLGYLVETLSGTPLWKYASRDIFSPLGMKETTYRPFDKVCTSDPSIAIRHQGGMPSLPLMDEDISCGRWGKLSRIAPTAHDNEGTAQTNLDFDRVLRGTVHDPTTRRMGGVAGHAGVFSTAHDAALFCQALLDRLLRDTGTFPLKQSTLRIMTTPQQPATTQAATVFTSDGKPTQGQPQRGFGWDINSAYSRPRGEVFPIGSFGHTGFTGTSLWLDPVSDSYVILLANAIHPRGGAPISTLRGQVAMAAARALGASTGSSRALSESVAQSSKPVLAGIDVLEATHFAALKEAAARHGGRLRIGLLTNQTGLDAQGKRTVDVLVHSIPEVRVTALFTPEHGLYGKQDTEKLKAEEDQATHLPVVSLYGPKPADKRPKPADLAKLDAVIIDLQDAGVRFYTYETIVGYFVEATACTSTEIIVLDRPTLTASFAPNGPVSDKGLESYVNYMPEPSTPAMTLGELAQFIHGERGETCEPNPRPAGFRPVTVVPMQHWTRDQFFADTGMPWTNPSPNLKSARAAILYPGIGLAETANISVGRGTEAPFEHLGAPWIKAEELAGYLSARKIPGVRITPTALTIAEDSNHYPSHGTTIPGIHFEVTDRNVLDAPELGIEVLSALQHLYPRDFQLAKAQTNLCNAATLAALERGDDPRAIAKSWIPALKSFDAQRRKYLIYH